jgi:hypothetical protein
MIGMMARHQLFQVPDAGTKPRRLMKTESVVVGEKISQPTGPGSRQACNEKVFFHNGTICL